MNEEAITELSTMFKDYTKNLAKKIQTIENLWSNLQANWSKENAAELYRAVHSINGSSGIYCYYDLQKATGKIENLLQSIKTTEDLKASQDNLNSQIASLPKIFRAASTEKTLKIFLEQNANS